MLGYPGDGLQIERFGADSSEAIMHLPELSPTMNFAQASAAVVDFLQREVPMGLWSVTRCDGERQMHLEVRDEEYGFVPGSSVDWGDSFCKHTVEGGTPGLALDAMAIPELATTAAAATMPIGSYVGIPIKRAGGEVYGTFCAIDPERKGPDWERHRPMLELLSTLLAGILDADLARTTQKRALERAELEADTDELTGLLDRRGWQRYLELEEDRYRRFGDPASVIVADLDGLKRVNESRGVAAGDELLRAAARTIRSLVRAGDVVARLGGDEFGVVVADATDAETAALIRRLQDGLRETGVAGSLGHAPYTIADGLAGAWDEADRAMHATKRQRLRIAS